MSKQLALPEVLSRLGISRATLYRWIAQRGFPRAEYQRGRSILWTDSQVDRWRAINVHPVRGVRRRAPTNVKREEPMTGAKTWPFKWEYRVLEYGVGDPAFPPEFDFPDDDEEVHEIYENAWLTMMKRGFELVRFEGLVSPEDVNAPQPFIMRQHVDLSPLEGVSQPHQIASSIADLVRLAETEFLFETAADAVEFKLISLAEDG